MPTQEIEGTSPSPKEIAKAVQELIRKNRERINSIDLKQHYKDAIAYLDENYAYFLTDVLNMGRPVWTNGIPTAAVGLRDKKDYRDFVYIFNPHFAALLEPEEVAFIAAHETLHILFYHLRLLCKLADAGYDKLKLNISADAILDDYLVSQGFDPGRLRSDDPEKKSTIIFGEEVVGYNCAHASVRQVYRDIPDSFMEEFQKGGGGSGGIIIEYCEGSGGNATGDHEWMYDKANDKANDEIVQEAGVPQDIEERTEAEQGEARGGTHLGPGSEAGALKRFQEQKGVSFDWAKLLAEVDPDLFKVGGKKQKPAWHKKRRKLIGIAEYHPDMGNLPSTHEPQSPKGETPAIAMYMDGSGSCYDWIDRFVTLAKSVPKDRIKLWSYSFSTYVQPLDLLSDNIGLASGGTAFSPIEESIRKDIIPQLGHYPKAVVIMSDGEGQFNGMRPESQYADRWLWLIKGNYSWSDRCGKDIDIAEFCKGMNFNNT